MPKGFITNSKGAGALKITDKKLYFPVVTVSTQDNAKLLQQLKSGLKQAVNWNKYQETLKVITQNWYLSYFIEASFQEVDTSFVCVSVWN